MAKKEEIKRTIDKLSKVVKASAVVSRDGLIIVADLPEDVNEETVAAMSATLVGTAEQVCSELKSGIFQRAIVEGKEGKIISIGAGPFAILVCIASPESKLGLVLMEMSRAAEEIKKIIKE